MQKEFWKNKELKDFTKEEWEALCDGCGKCCFNKVIDGHLWNKKVYLTCVACNLLDVNTLQCTDYNNRFLKQKSCIKLNPHKVKHFKWLPKTCAYRLIYEKKELYPWHPLISGNKESVKEAGITVQDGINECNAFGKDSLLDYYDYIIEEI